MPSARSSTALWRARAVTPRFTRAMVSLLPPAEIRGERHHRPQVGRVHLVLRAVLPLALGGLVFQQVRTERLAPHHLAGAGDAEPLLGSLMGSDLWHLDSPGWPAPARLLAPCGPPRWPGRWPSHSDGFAALSWMASSPAGSGSSSCSGPR